MFSAQVEWLGDFHGIRLELLTTISSYGVFFSFARSRGISLWRLIKNAAIAISAIMMRTDTTPAATAVWLDAFSAMWGWDSMLLLRVWGIGVDVLEPQLLSAFNSNSDKHSQTPTPNINLRRNYCVPMINLQFLF